MKNKILIVGLDTAYNKSLAQNLANESGAYFLDIEDYVSYSLFNVHTMKEKCGIVNVVLFFMTIRGIFLWRT